LLSRGYPVYAGRITRNIRIAGAVAALALASCGSQATQTVTVTTSSAISTPVASATASTAGTSTTTSGGLSPQIEAAIHFNQAFSDLHDSINRLSKGISRANTLAQIAALYSSEVKLRSKFDTAISNIDFPAADRSDVKALLVADTGVENAESTIAGDENAGNAAMLKSDGRAVDSAMHQFDAALTAVQYDVGDA
jgi:hypothetical protein